MEKYVTKNSKSVDSEIPMSADRWLYQWQGEPTREFLLHKIIFRAGSPSDIHASGWQIVPEAVLEMAKYLRVPGRTSHIARLNLDYVNQEKCLLGVHRNETVAVALPLHNMSKPFIPSRYYECIANNSEWRDVEYRCSYRHFCVSFHNGLTFYTDKFRWMCEPTWYLYIGVRGVHWLWSSIRINDRIIVVPYRFRISDTLTDLPGKIQKLSMLGQSLIQKLGAAWVLEHDYEDRWSLASSVLSRLPENAVPAYLWNELQEDQEIMSCHTRLEMLLFLSKIFRTNPVGHVRDLMTLTKLLLGRDECLKQL